MQNLDFVFFDAGGGHRSAATALKQVIEAEGRPWRIRMVNLQEVLDELDLFRRYTGIRLEDQYNRLLKNGWTLGAEYMLPPLQFLIRLYHKAQVRLLTRYWQSEPPDLVVSFIPHFNGALHAALQSVNPDLPLVTIITDFADFPPHFWLERQRQYVVCGTKKAVEQAHAHGFSDDLIFRTSGMIIQPRFYEPVTKDRRIEREGLGLAPDRCTGLVLFGGQGSKVMGSILSLLDASELDLQLILICGHNQHLATELESRPTRILKHVEGFTQEIPYYMHCSDFFIGKPGPGSISEALAMHLPVIVERNAWTLPQERYNADWVLEQQVGIVVPKFTEIVGAVQRLLDPEAFARYRSNASAINNQAVFEIPEFLETLLTAPRK